MMPASRSSDVAWRDCYTAALFQAGISFLTHTPSQSVLGVSWEMVVIGRK